MNVFVIAETQKGAHELCGGARMLGDAVYYVALGSERVVTGIADKVYMVDLPEGVLIESAAQSIVELFKNEQVDVVLIEPTRRMKIVGGKVASRFGTSVVTDVKNFEGSIASNLYFGGIATRRYKNNSGIAFYTCGVSPFGEVSVSGTDEIEKVSYIDDGAGVVLRSRDPLPPSDVDLNAAKCIVAAGRGFGAEEDLEMAKTFASLMGAELGCTRPLTEAEDWMPRETYIGVSGLMLSPEIYIGIGVSGQMQHMVGVDTAKVTFAINKDKNAPIFRQVDYGLVGDLYAVLPQINERLSQ